MYLCRSVKLARQEAEIAACEWLDPEVYLQQEFFLRSEVYNKINRVVHTAVSTGSFPAFTELNADVTSERQDSNSNSNPHRQETSQVDVNMNVAALVTEKLPIGFRPGMHSLYFLPETVPPKTP